MSEQTINLTQLLDTFQLLDKNKDGCISSNEFRLACEKFQMPIDEDKLTELFANRNSITFDQFCQLMQEFGQHAHDAYLNETFRAFDRNADGYITVKEIKKTMKDLGETLTDKQAKDMLKAADSNRDGKLSRDEFRHLFTYITQQAATPPISLLPTTSDGEHTTRSNNPFQPATE